MTPRRHEEYFSSDEGLLYKLIVEIDAMQEHVEATTVFDAARASAHCMDLAKCIREVLNRHVGAIVPSDEELKRLFATVVSDVKERNRVRLNASLQALAGQVAQQFFELRLGSEPNAKGRGAAVASDIARELAGFLRSSLTLDSKLSLLLHYLSLFEYIVDWFLWFFQDSSLAHPLAKTANSFSLLGSFLPSLLLSSSPEAANIEAKPFVETLAEVVGSTGEPHFYSGAAIEVDPQLIRKGFAILNIHSNSPEMADLRAALRAPSTTDIPSLLVLLSALDTALGRQLTVLGNTSPSTLQRRIDALFKRLGTLLNSIEAQLRLVRCCGDQHPFHSAVLVYRPTLTALTQHIALCFLLADIFV